MSQKQYVCRDKREGLCSKYPCQQCHEIGEMIYPPKPAPWCWDPAFQGNAYVDYVFSADGEYLIQQWCRVQNNIRLDPLVLIHATGRLAIDYEPLYSASQFAEVYNRLDLCLDRYLFQKIDPFTKASIITETLFPLVEEHVVLRLVECPIPDLLPLTAGPEQVDIP
uniref:C3H1-type domain-containing protein n=1 Tax=Panagrellus redivivus TaxID=6233 RepID=A0A7E4VUQ3_PANRE